MSDKDLMQTTDAHAWADEFNRILTANGGQPHDPAWLVAWFSSAIMCGHDSRRKELDKAKVEIERLRYAHQKDDLTIEAVKELGRRAVDDYEKANALLAKYAASNAALVEALEDIGACTPDKMDREIAKRALSSAAALRGEREEKVCTHESTWFDRTISYYQDGKEDGMHTRCSDCGINLDGEMEKDGTV